MFWFFTFPSKVLHWNMSSILTLRSRPSYCIGTCHMFWFYAPVQIITLEHVYVLILLSRSKYYIGTCPMFWFYPPVQTITLEHVLCSNFTFPFKVLHWNMSYVLSLRFAHVVLTLMLVLSVIRGSRSRDRMVVEFIFFIFLDQYHQHTYVDVIDIETP